MQDRLRRQDRQDKNKLLRLDLTGKILNCCFEVMRELGSGFLESIYRNALIITLKEQNINACAEKPFEMVFKGQKIGLYVADIVVENAIIVELKRSDCLLPEHQAQLINYLKVANLPVGLLVNFGNRRLQYTRLHHPAYPAGEADPAYPVPSHG